MPGHSVIGRLATFDSSSVMWPLKPGSMKPAVECVSSPRRPSDDLPSSRPGEVVGQRAQLQRRARARTRRVQHERLPLGGSTRLVSSSCCVRRVDVGVAGVVEDPEQVVEPDVDAGRLDQAVVERVDAQPPGGDFGPDVAIGEQHATSVAAGGAEPVVSHSA